MMDALVETEIGRLPATWKVQRLREVFETQLGKMLSQKARAGDAPKPYLRNKNVQWGRIDVSDILHMDFDEREIEKFRLRAGDLLICEGGEPGRAAIWNGALTECFYQKALHRLRPRDGRMLNDFMNYWLRFSFDLQNLYGVAGASSTIAHLPEVQLKSLPIPVPPLPEQRKISGVLGIVQQAIEQQERLLALTAELKKTLLHRIFTRGLRGEPQKQTEIGPVPESWLVLPLSDVISEDPKNGLYKHSSAYGEGTPILRIDDFSNDGDIVTSASNRVVTEGSEHLLYALRKNDIVTNRVNSLSHLGKTALVGELPESMVFESNMMRFRVDEQRALPGYVFRLLNSPVCKKQIIGSAKRAVGQSSINQGNLKAILLPLPSVAIQKEICAILETVVAKVRLHELKKRSLTDAFRTLLHQLMTAQIRVRDLELSMPGATGLGSQNSDQRKSEP